MDWLKSILQSLPLDKISDLLGEIIIWWSQMVKGVPPADLPMYAYLGGSTIVLLLWILVARMMPRPLGGMSWMVIFAVLLAPGTALGDPSQIAPASISVVYAIMMKDIAGAVANSLPILVVLVVGLFVGFVWQLIRGAFESSLDKARRSTEEDAQANMQLATGNYLGKETALEEKSSEKKSGKHLVEEVLAAKNSKMKAPPESSQLTKQESEVSLQKPSSVASSVDSKADSALPTALEKPTEPVSKALDEPIDTTTNNNTPVKEVTDKKL